ncbi:MAG: envelope stress response membrane protein PspB [Gammaproteobacteria bacterium]|nr:envelope stress response membrane protein PspB [Gammaproteobacteria bacterium]
MSMPIAAFVLMTLFMVIVLPIIVIMHYVTKWKEARGLSTEEQELLEELWRASQKMESRLNSLETILDDQAPDWKKKT